MQAVQLVIFDLDDTLIRTVEAIIASRRAVLAHWKTVHPSFDITRAFNTWKHLFWHFRNEFHPDLLRLLLRDQGVAHPSQHIAKAQDVYFQTYWQTLVVNEGTIDILTHLHKNNVKTAVCSNGNAAFQQKKLKNTGLSPYVKADEFFVAPSWSLKAKPSPEGLRWLMRRQSVTPAETLYVGDRAVDMIAGNMAHVTTVLYRSNFQSIDVEDCARGAPFFVEQPKHTICHLAQLRKIVG